MCEFKSRPRNTRNFKGNRVPRSVTRPLRGGLTSPSRGLNLRSGQKTHQALHAWGQDVKIESKLRVA
jgi:hypothetical protein